MKDAEDVAVASRITAAMKAGMCLYGLLTLAAIVAGWNASRPIPLSLLREQHPRSWQGARYTPSKAMPAVSSCGVNQQVSKDGKCRLVDAPLLRHRDVEFLSTLSKSGPARLRGTLCVPQVRGVPKPAVLLIHGSGPQSRDGNLAGDLARPKRQRSVALLKELANLLCRHGFVVLRYDKRSCLNCYPDVVASAKTFRFRDHQHDAEDALEYLRRLDSVDAHRLVLVAHSQGAKAAASMAQGDPGVKALVLLAPALLPVVEGVLEQLLRAAALRRAMFDWVGYARLKREHDSHRDCFSILEQEPKSDAFCFAQGVGLQALRVERAQAASAVQALFGSRIPTLMVHGALDINVDVAASIRRIARASNDHLHLRVVPNAGHLLRDLQKPDASVAFHPDVKASIVRFLSREFATLPAQVLP
jgi:uncharacterized protein